jgi:succinate-semialdehyde dehydrogenase / glutarate-semialdehyde dehydrogenase
MYQDVLLLIDNAWTRAASGKVLEVVNPATGETIGTVAHAGVPDLDRAVAAAARGFAVWRRMPAMDRAKVMRRAAALVRERADEIARLMTLEQGKPLAEAQAEVVRGADTIDWFADEALRIYGRTIPPRGDGVLNLVLREPVGPVAAFSPWNFPVNQLVKKVAAALAAGCSIIAKAPEETPASPAELVRAFVDAGTPPGVIGLVYGTPSEISEYLIPHPVIRKISFTGSTAVGKHLAGLAAQHVKRITLELGGHAPAIVFEDADLDRAVKALAGSKFRNAGQVCISPTRFLVQERVYDRFLDGFVRAAEKVKVGDGLSEDTEMGPLANARRIPALEDLIQDAVRHGAALKTGGKRIGNNGNFFEPTVLAEVPAGARIMNEEPFGPVAIVNRFAGFDDAVAEANRTAYGLAAYAFTGSSRTMARLGEAVDSGMLTINHVGFGLPELPFGGVKESGYGVEGGSEGVDAYLQTKLVTQTAA